MNITFDMTTIIVSLVFRVAALILVLLIIPDQIRNFRETKLKRLSGLLLGLLIAFALANLIPIFLTFCFIQGSCNNYLGDNFLIYITGAIQLLPSIILYLIYKKQ